MKFGNKRVRAFTSQTGSKSWSEFCLKHHWNLAQNFATLPGRRWIKRVLAWQHLATTGAQTQWPPKIFLGYFDYKFLPLEEFTFMGGLCNWCRTLAFKPAWIFGVLQVLMYIGSSFTIFPLCLKQAAQWGIQGWHWHWHQCRMMNIAMHCGGWISNMRGHAELFVIILWYDTYQCITKNTRFHFPWQQKADVLSLQGIL